MGHFPLFLPALPLTTPHKVLNSSSPTMANDEQGGSHQRREVGQSRLGVLGAWELQSRFGMNPRQSKSTPEPSTAVVFTASTTPFTITIHPPSTIHYPHHYSHPHPYSHPLSLFTSTIPISALASVYTRICLPSSGLSHGAL